MKEQGLTRSSEFTPTPEEEQSLAYANYPTCPRRIDMAQSIEDGTVRLEGDDIVCKLSEKDIEIFQEEEVRVRPRGQYNWVEPTLSGLNDYIIRTAGTNPYTKQLRDIFEQEQDAYYKLVAEGKEISYGSYFLYPDTEDLVQFPPEEIHRLALIASHWDLYNNPRGTLDAFEAHQILQNLVIAVAGGSVGSNIGRTFVMDSAARNFKIADLRAYKTTNAGRVIGGYREFVLSKKMQTVFGGLGGAMKNKAISAAEQLHARNPYINIWPYWDGVTEQNVGSFIGGNRYEPRADVLIEETDNPLRKFEIRERARALGCDVLMATDRGSKVQVDIRPFKSNPQASLAYGISDEELITFKEVYEKASSRDTFFKFVDGMIGPAYRLEDTEFGRLMRNEIKTPIPALQQLGSTAIMAGGLLTEVIARRALGYMYPERFMLDKTTLSVSAEGEKV